MSALEGSTGIPRGQQTSPGTALIPKDSHLETQESTKDFSKDSEVVIKNCVNVAQHFNEFTLSMDPGCTVRGTLANEELVIMLIDTGASHTVVSQHLVAESADCLIKAEMLENPMYFRVASGDKICGNERVTFTVRFGSDVLTITGIVLSSNLGVYDIIYGVNGLENAAALIDFATFEVTFQENPTIYLRLDQDTSIPPHTTNIVKLEGDLPKHYKHKELILKPTTQGKQYMPCRVCVCMTDRSCLVPINNNSDQPMQLHKGAKLLQIDTELLYGAVQYVAVLPPLEPAGQQEVVNKLTVTKQPEATTGTCCSAQHTNQPPTNENELFTPSEEFYNDMTQDDLYQYHTEKFPFLEPDDPRLKMNPYEVLRAEIDLETDCVLDNPGKSELMDILESHITAFSTHQEIGDTKFVIDLPITDKSSNKIRAYNIPFSFRSHIDKEMDRLKKLGVVEEGLAVFSSPIMLIAKKEANAPPRIVQDLRVLNSKIEAMGYDFPLTEECLNRIGYNKSTYISIVDITDAFFGIHLSKESQKFTGISSYPSAKAYRFIRLPMGLSNSPAYFSEFLTSILTKIPNYQDFLANYIDDVVIFSKSKADHMKHLDLVLALFEEHGIKIKPKKAQFFRRSVDFLGHQIIVEDEVPKVRIQNSKIDTILKLKPPHNLKSVRGFCGFVQYLAKFLPKLSELLDPMRVLTKKNASFVWSSLCQKNFEEIKRLIVQAPVLHLPTREGVFRLYIDSSRTGVGATVWQASDTTTEIERLVGYYSKKFTPAVLKYSVSEMELLGIVTCLNALKYLRCRVVQVFTDHSSLIHLINSKKELPSLRLKRLYQHLSGFSFTLTHKSGKHMICCDFLSRSDYYDDVDMNNPPTVALQCQYEGTNGCQQDMPDLADQEQEALTGTADDLTEQEQEALTASVMSIKDNNPDPAFELTPTDDDHEQEALTGNASLDINAIVEPFTGSADGQSSHNTDIQQHSAHLDTAVVCAITRSQSRQINPQQDSDTIHPAEDELSDYNLRSDSVADQQLADELTTNKDSSTHSDADLISTAESSPAGTTLVGHQINKQPQAPDIPQDSVVPKLTPAQPEEVITPSLPPQDLYRPLSQLFLPDSPIKVINKRVPSQCDLTSFIEKVKARSLRDFSLPIAAQEITLQQRNDPYFKDIYMFLKAGVLPSNVKVARNIKNLAEDFILVNEVLFKILDTNNQEIFRLLLAIPAKSAHYIISMFHNSLWSAHFGIKKTFQQIRSKYFIPQLYQKLHQYIQSCETCQERKIPQSVEETHDLVPRYIKYHDPFAHLHLDIKYLFPGLQNYQFLLVIVDLCTRYTLGFPLKRIAAIDVAEILLQKVCLVYGFCKSITTDQGKEFDNKIMAFLTKSCDIQTHFVTVASHESLLAERHIKTLSEVLIGKIKNYGKLWPLFINAATYAINTAPIMLFEGLSAFELLYARSPRDPLSLNAQTLIPEAPMAVQEYMASLKQRLQEIGDTATELHNQYQEQQYIENARKIKRKPLLATGDLVYLLSPMKGSLHTGNSKIKTHYVGPLVVQSVYDDRQVTLCDLSGQPIYGLFSTKRLKRAYFKVAHKNATNIADIQEAMSKLEKLRKTEHNMVQVTPQNMFCMRDGQSPVTEDINQHLGPVDKKARLTNKCDIPLLAYSKLISENNLRATLTHRPPKAYIHEIKLEQKQPDLNDDLFIRKLRYKQGDLELLFSDGHLFHLWIKADEVRDTSLKDLALQEVPSNHTSPSGRLWLSFTGDRPVVTAGDQDVQSLPITGSLLKFNRWLTKPSKSVVTVKPIKQHKTVDFNTQVQYH
jgi:putative transposase